MRRGEETEVRGHLDRPGILRGGVGVPVNKGEGDARGGAGGVGWGRWEEGGCERHVCS